jgi:hypothetical protein
MREYRLRAILTPARRRWLETLERGPSLRLSPDRAASDCLTLGWSDWEDEGHCLTEAGRLVLRQARQEEQENAT